MSPSAAASGVSVHHTSGVQSSVSRSAVPRETCSLRRTRCSRSRATSRASGLPNGPSASTSSPVSSSSVPGFARASAPSSQTTRAGGGASARRSAPGTVSSGHKGSGHQTSSASTSGGAWSTTWFRRESASCSTWESSRSTSALLPPAVSRSCATRASSNSVSGLGDIRARTSDVSRVTAATGAWSRASAAARVIWTSTHSSRGSEPSGHSPPHSAVSARTAPGRCSRSAANVACSNGNSRTSGSWRKRTASSRASAGRPVASSRRRYSLGAARADRRGSQRAAWPTQPASRRLTTSARVPAVSSPPSGLSTRSACSNASWASSPRPSARARAPVMRWYSAATAGAARSSSGATASSRGRASDGLPRRSIMRAPVSSIARRTSGSPSSIPAVPRSRTVSSSSENPDPLPVRSR